MKKSKYSVTFKVLVGYLLLTAFGAVTIWFIYNKVVKLRSSSVENSNQKMVLISEVATRLYTAESISRNLIQNTDTTKLVKFHHAIDTISGILDSLETLYTDQTTRNELDTIRHLLRLKEKNLQELLEFRVVNESNNYYDRVLKRLEKADYVFGSTNYKEMLDGLKPYQREVVIKYLKYAERDNADRLTNRTVDSLVSTVKQTLLSLAVKEHQYQKKIAQKEQKLLTNNLKISHRLQKIRARIEKEELQKSVARMKSSQEALNQASIIMIVFGFACVITIFVFVIIIVRDTNRSRRYRKALEDAKSYAERLLKSREQIMATVTHDLRSPLNSILGYSDLIDKTELNSRQKSYLDHLKKSSDYTMRLVNDMLDFSRLEAGKILIEMLPFVPQKLIEDSVDTSIPSPDPKNLNVVLNLRENFSHTFLSDPFRIRQILANLIGNAYKFTDEGTLEIVGETIEENDQTFLQITVKDSGIGISKAQQKIIFNEFSQAETSTEKQYGGSGLGLAISHKLAQLLEGSIEVDSEPGKGSQFTLTIPVEATTQSSEQKPEGPLQITNVDDQHILLVDDDKMQLNLTQEILKNQGFEVTTAAEGKTALNKIKKGDFDAVLTDIQMPQLDGFELIEQLRKDKATRNLPVIAISGEANKTKYVYLESGFTDYLLKPYDANELLKIIARVLHLKTKITKSTENKPAVEEEGLYNLDDLKTFTDGDEESLKAIVESLIENTETNLERLTTAKTNANWEEVAFTAHKMLPMLRQIKAGAVVEPLDKLEHQKSEALTPKTVKILVDKVLKNSKLLLEALAEEVK